MNPFARRLTDAVRVILIVSAAVFIVQFIVDRVSGGVFRMIFSLHLAGLLRLYIWQPVSYMFLHGDILHILMNMLVLYFFGCEMEDVLGSRRFLQLYFGSGLLAGFGWLAINVMMGGRDYCMGASGAVFGVMGAFAAMFPDRTITLLVFFVLPVTMTARTMVAGVGLISLVFLVMGDRNVAHAAHLAGGIAGYVYGLRIARNPGLIDPLLNPPASAAGFISGIRARLMRRRMHVVDGHDEPPSPAEVDRILEKIKETGIQSLSRKERRVLEQASREGREKR